MLPRWWRDDDRTASNRGSLSRGHRQPSREVCHGARLVVGMACVVGVLTSMLSLTAGLTRAYLRPEDATRAIVWAERANFDQSRSLHRDVIGTILDAPGTARSSNGAALADPEFLMRIPPLAGLAAG